MSVEQFAGLTQRQLYDLYCHPRDEHGNVEPRGGDAEPTDEEADAAALAMARAFGKPEDVERVKETIRKREEARRG